MSHSLSVAGLGHSPWAAKGCCLPCTNAGLAQPLHVHALARNTPEKSSGLWLQEDGSASSKHRKVVHSFGCLTKAPMSQSEINIRFIKNPTIQQ